MPSNFFTLVQPFIIFTRTKDVNLRRLGLPKLGYPNVGCLDSLPLRSAVAKPDDACLSKSKPAPEKQATRLRDHLGLG